MTNKHIDCTYQKKKKNENRNVPIGSIYSGVYFSWINLFSFFSFVPTHTHTHTKNDIGCINNNLIRSKILIHKESFILQELELVCHVIGLK